MKVLVVMGPPEAIDPETDTTLVLIEAAREHGHRVWCCANRDIEFADGAPHARARTVTSTGAQGAVPAISLGPVESVDLRAADVVLIRSDPPFDPDYLHMTLILDHLRDTTLVVNSPRGLRDANEKLYALGFPDVTPPTVVSADAPTLTEFASTHEAAVLKPIDGHGGRGVMIVRAGDPNGASIIDTLTSRGRTPVVAQQFIDQVSEGDKRILLLDGAPLGAILRVPTEADFRANICAGGEVRPVGLDADDHRIIEHLAPVLRRDGLAFVGIDVIGGQLTEVNVTSPTGLRQLCGLSADRPDLDVIEWLERSAAA